MREFGGRKEDIDEALMLTWFAGAMEITDIIRHPYKPTSP